MRNDVLYKMIAGACLFGLFVTMSNAVSAEDDRYWDSPRYTAPTIDHSYNSETGNPWYQSDPQSYEPGIWSLPPEQSQSYENQFENYSGNQPPDYEPQNDSRGYLRPDATSEFQQVPEHRTRQQPWQVDTSQDRYVTPEIIDKLNRQEAQHYARQHSGRYGQFVPTSPSYDESRARGHSAPPAYGVGSLNPAFDVPAVSPWGGMPDVLNSGEQFPWMPNEAVGGVPPIHVSPYTNKNDFDERGNSATPSENKVFNPYTFLQNEN
jgi:hypothetical protein